MQDGLVVVLLAVGLGGCGTQSQGTGAGGNGGGGIGGTTGNGGAAAGGRAAGSGGASAAAGSAGDTGGAGQTSSSGGAGTSGQGTSGNSGSSQTGGLAGIGGATTNGGTAGAGGAAPGGTAGSAAGSPGASGGSGLGGASGAAGATNAGSAPGGAGGTAPTCTLPALTSGDSTVTLQAGGRSRKYTLHVPPGLTAGTPVPLVFDLHGAGGNGAQQKGMSGFSSLADKERFLAVFPDGIDGYWNVDDKCCGTAGDQKIDDVGFLRAIITTLSDKTCIDANRIYVSGFSNGGGLTHRMGCDAADVIAAIAPMSTDLRTQPCNASRPLSMMEVRGMADSLEPYEGGVVGPEGGQYVDVGAKASLALWAEINQCTGTTTKLDTYCDSYKDCAGGVETNLCSLPNVDHSPYNNSLGFDVASVAWSMFKRHTLK